MIVPNKKNHHEIYLQHTHTRGEHYSQVFFPNFYKVIWDLLNDDDSLDFQCERGRTKTCASNDDGDEHWAFCLKKLKKKKRR